MPLLQLGTAQLLTETGLDETVPPAFTGMLPERAYRQLELALQQGVRAFDTAFIYRSQPAMGHVLAEWWRTAQLKSRTEVWITTKVFHPDATQQCFGISHMPDMARMSPDQVSVRTREHFETSMVQLGVGYIDLLLLHWPSGLQSDGEDHDAASSEEHDNRQRRLAAWRVLEDLYERGWARAIGVSNFAVHHLEQLREDGATIVPMVNQIEASVTLQYTDILQYCKDHGIVAQAYSPFGRGLYQMPDALTGLATKYGKDVGQIAIRYLVQQGYAVTFLSNSEQRMVTNTQVFDFELSKDEMELLHSFNRPDGGWGLPDPHELL